MEELTYEQIRKKALNNHISDNPTSIGMWASFQGYIKRKKLHNSEVRTIYLMPTSNTITDNAPNCK